MKSPIVTPVVAALIAVSFVLSASVDARNTSDAPSLDQATADAAMSALRNHSVVILGALDSSRSACAYDNHRRLAICG